MTGPIDRLRRALARRTSARLALSALRRTPMDARLDLNLYSGNFPLIVRRATRA